MAASSANWTSLFYLFFFTFFIKVKLGGLVSQLYKLAFQTYHDIPRGPIKVENSARWFMVLVLVMVIVTDTVTMLTMLVMGRTIRLMTAY